MTDFSRMTTEEFDSLLREHVSVLTPAQLLSIPGIYEILSEYFNNPILDDWSDRRQYVLHQIVFNQLTKKWESLGPEDDPWEDEHDLVEDIHDNAYWVVELGQDIRPLEVPDIRGDIVNPPERVFAVQDEEGGAWTYWGVRHISSL